MTSPVESKFELPPELWGKIFGHLRGKHLLPVRQVCRLWRAIVDQNRSLYGRFRIVFHHCKTLNAACWPERFAPATVVQFIGDPFVLGSWWPPLGQLLTCVGLHHLKIALGALLGMLRETPNLEELQLCLVEYTSTEEPAVDFRLEKLEKLQIVAEVFYEDQEPVKSNFESFVSMFPYVKDLEVGLQEVDEKVTAQLIDSVQGTLVRLKLQATDYILDKMYRMDRLQLKTFELSFADEDQDRFDMSKFQSLEELDISDDKELLGPNSYFCEIGRNHPNLKLFAIGILGSFPEDNYVPTFLATMPQLEVLKIDGEGSEYGDDGLGVKIDFDGVQSPNLKELALKTTHPIGDSLRTFLGGSGNLQKLRFICTALTRWSMLLAILADNSSLLHLTLKNSSFAILDVPPNPQPTNLEFLEVFNCPTIKNETIIHLASLIPRLRQLRLASMGKLNDHTVQQLCRQLPLLTRLRIGHCNRVKGTCAADILDHCPALVYLGVDHSKRIFDAVRTVLQERGGGRYIELEMENCEQEQFELTI